MNTFSKLGLSSQLQKVLPELGLEVPSPIQQQAIPILVNEHRDFIGLAQTGTGKTAAFGLPLLDSINLEKKYTQALVLAPTRELGQQIAQNLIAFAKYLPAVRVLAVYGGASITEQMRSLRNTTHIIIATPGRLIDLIERKAIKLDRISHVVLDEADEMLNMGFKEDIDKILSFAPSQKLTWLFSATMPREIRGIVNKYMNNPAEVSVSTGKEGNVNIEHQYIVVKHSDKTEAIKRFLDIDKGMRGIIFCRTKLATQNLAEELAKDHYRVEALHGDLSQSQRDRVMKRFKAHTLQVLVATDVAARGIDVNDLTHIFHHSLPDDLTYYTHRSGRTARAGKKGISLALITNRETGRLHMLEKKMRISFIKIDVPKVADMLMQTVVQWADKIDATEVPDSIKPDMLAIAQSKFENTSKSELIAKLVANELGRLSQNKTFRDLNDTASRPERSSGRDSLSRKERPDRKDSGKMVRFFINIGSVDKISKKELLQFICEQAELSPKDIGDISVQKKCTYFDVDKRFFRKVAPSFKNISIDGRKIRVNRDEKEGMKSRKEEYS